MVDRIIIGNKTFPTIFAISSQEQEKGLMGVKWPPPIMSFPYNYKSYNKFWMANTPSPLDIIFACQGKIIDIQNGEPFSLKAIGGDYLSDLVVEMPQGSCSAYNIKVGDQISFEFSDHSINKLGLFSQIYKK